MGIRWWKQIGEGPGQSTALPHDEGAGWRLALPNMPTPQLRLPHFLQGVLPTSAGAEEQGTRQRGGAEADSWDAPIKNPKQESKEESGKEGKQGGRGTVGLRLRKGEGERRRNQSSEE